MGKTMKQVLPDLKTAEHLMEKLERMEVERMTMPKDRSSVRFYISCKEIIQKKDINILEAAIKSQYFRNKSVKVKIFEHFELENMTPEQAYERYRDSILLELKSFHVVDYTMFQSAQVTFTSENIMMLDVEDTLMNHAHSRELCQMLETLFNDRLGFSLEVRCQMGHHTKTVYHADPEAEMEAQVRKIQEANAEARAAQKAAAAREAAGTAKKEFYKSPKKRMLTEEEGYGREFDGDPLSINQITGEIGEVVIQGQIIKTEVKEIKTGNFIVVFVITDKTDSIKAKIFCKPDQKNHLLSVVKDGAFVRLKGLALVDKFDRDLVISSIEGIIKEKGALHERKDESPVKRVELHCHTQMSDMDAVTHTSDLIKRAAAWGQKAIAITDHGVVQSFPDAMHTVEKLKTDFKVIYGCEGYLVDDTQGKTMEELKKARARHVILLAKNDVGRINLYRLVSESHLKYYHKRPRIPKSLLQECREGIIIGSACEAGELFQALVNHESDEEIARLVNFYDYLEVQPVGNNAFMLRDNRYEAKTNEDLQEYVRRIVELGEQFGKPVVATCDVHFLDPEDEIYRRIIQKGQGYADADMQPPLYLRTTEEMMNEFDFLGRKKAEEIVITNSNLICDMCEPIAPVRPDKCPPVIEGSEEELRNMCYEKAHSMYGDPLPTIVQERLEKELHSIIGNGFAVMYIIAQRLVKHSNEAGYMVGSRGSVGSSFVATMASITEVNPLSPHYRCPECKFSIWDSPETREHAGGAGCDMPDKNCPKCGAKMIKDGFDIPFETFLGFKGDKEPDIDLNFSGEDQGNAHKYTGVLFGAENTFRAGTIGTLAEKTAFGYVLKYYEEKNVIKRSCEMERIAAGCVGVRRTTGQHPGGIVVMPKGENIYSFTPVQHPANDMTTDTITTHFDYHSIDHNLLKLDILGHDDPTMIRRLEVLLDMDAKTIPLDDQKVMGIFKGTESLGIEPKDIGGTPLGTLGIPEFGTDFAMQMVIDAKPTCFADLVRISGLSHGTDVWLGNAQTLILEGTATLETAICTRDDIMLYLISMGMDKSLSFTIMEAVRKGKGLKPEWEEAMKAANVPDWYMASCKKIGYMFPKAHAAAYVMMAWRVAYCKVYHPLAYYTAYCSIRADGFNYELMCLGKDRLDQHIARYRQNSDNLTDKEKLTLREMRIVQEMYARGYEFMPIDIYRAKAKDFQIIDGKIMPSLCSIEGMGEKAAEGLEEAAKNGPFLSREDLCQRSKVSKTMADTMADLGLLGNMPKTNQISLFDFDFE